MTKEQKNDIDLTKAPIKSLIKKIAIPAGIGFFFNTMYNVVDTYFAGMLSTEALAALSISFPVFFIIIALGSGIGTGSTALISNAVGENNMKKARLISMQAVTFAMFTAFVLGVIMYFSSPFLFRLLGASDNYLSLSLSYMNTIIFGVFFFFLTFTFNSILSAQGDTRPFRNFLVFGFFLNIFLNYFLVFGLFGFAGIGFRGIALATVLIQLIGSVYMFSKALQTPLFNKDSFKKIKPNLEIYKEISGQGFPASLNMLSVALGAFIITYYVSEFGKDAVAAYGSALRIEQVVLLPCIGLNIATLSIVGQNNGAKKFDRVKEAVKTSLIFGAEITSVGAILMFVFSKHLMGVFSSSEEVILIGSNYLRIAAFASFGYVVLFLVVSALQGMKKPMYALYIGLFRQIIFPVIIFSLFVKVFSFGIESIWWGIFIIVWISAVISITYLKIVIKNAVEKFRMINH